MTDDDGLLSRWSRRKKKVAAESAALAKADDAPKPAEVAEPQTEEEEADLLERLGLPHPESLKEGDDFSAFMKAGVPEFLRKRALRVLWRSNPVLANLDGLNDYDDDFTSPELTQKVLATAYKVGRGILRDKPDDDAAAASESLAEDAVQEDEREAELALQSNESNHLPMDSVEPPEQEVQPDEFEEESPRPRRMRFEA